MMHKLLSAILICGVLIGTSKASTICKLDNEPNLIKVIAWNEADGTAKVTDALNNTFMGKVTLRRKHGDWGEKVNLYFKYDRTYYGADAVEYIVFPVGNGEFRMIYVTYVIVNDQKYLNTGSDSTKAMCVSL